MPSSPLILCCPLLLLPPIPPSIRVFSNESTLCMRWPKYWNFSFSISPSKEHPGLSSFRMDLLDLFAVQGLSRVSPTPQFKSIYSSVFSFLYSLTLTSTQEFGLIEIIPLIYAPQLSRASIVFLHPEFPQSTQSGMATLVDNLMVAIDMAGNILFCQRFSLSSQVQRIC